MTPTAASAKRRRYPRLADHTDPPPAPVERGRLWYDFQIAEQFLEGLPRISNKTRWVREHLPRDKVVKIGRDSAWYEGDIRAYLTSLEAGPR